MPELLLNAAFTVTTHTAEDIRACVGINEVSKQLNSMGQGRSWTELQLYNGTCSGFSQLPMPFVRIFHSITPTLPVFCPHPHPNRQHVATNKLNSNWAHWGGGIYPLGSPLVLIIFMIVLLCVLNKM